METTETRKESGDEEEDFGEFSTPVGAVMTPRMATTTTTTVTGMDGGLETVEAKDDDDDDEDDAFGEFSTPATTMRGVRFEEEMTPSPSTTTTETPIEAGTVEERTAARGGELDLCATRDEEFVDAVRKLLRLRDADGGEDGDAYVKTVMDELNAGDTTGGLMKQAAWEEYARRLELERSAPDKGLKVEIESVSTIEPVPEEHEREVVEVTPVAEPEPQTDLISLSLEDAEPSAPSAVAVDPFANFGALTIESPAKPVEVEPIMDDDDFGDFV
jgi:hypothetical protein